MTTDSPTPLADLTALTRRLHLASDSPDATDALNRASARFRAEVGFDPVLTTDDTIELDGLGVATLLLPGWPIVTVTTVLLGGAPVTDYQLSRRLGMIHRRGGWPWGFGNVEVTYTHGWTPEAIPLDIADAVLDQAEAIHRARAGIKSSTLGPQAVTFEAGATQAWSDTVARYARNGARPA